MELKGSKTEKNLYTAFTGEVQAYAKYHYYYEKAKEEGYEQLAEFFKYTANNELTHARLIFEKLMSYIKNLVRLQKKKALLK